jgi:CTP synthase (UTP-ammonia lyase)
MRAKEKRLCSALAAVFSISFSSSLEMSSESLMRRMRRVNPYASKLVISKLACSLAGRRLAINLIEPSLVSSLYGARSVVEQFYCNFGVNPDYVSVLSSRDLLVVGSDDEGEIRVVELRDHPFFVGTLFVPQMRSRPGEPHPLVRGFLAAIFKTAPD